jgi:hypothetical protein
MVMSLLLPLLPLSLLLAVVLASLSSFFWAAVGWGGRAGEAEGERWAWL